MEDAVFRGFTRSWRSSSRRSAPSFRRGSSSASGAGSPPGSRLARQRRMDGVPVHRGGARAGRLWHRERDGLGRALGWFALAAALGCALVWARSDWVAQPRLDAAGDRRRSQARLRAVDHLAARETVRLLVRPDDAALAAARPGLDRRGQVPARHRAAAPRSGCAPGWRRRRRWRCPGTYDFARDAWFQRHRRGRQAAWARCSRSTSRRSARPRPRARTVSTQHISARLPASPAGHRHRARHRRPECGRPGRCRRDAPQRPCAPAVGQRAPHRRGGRPSRCSSPCELLALERVAGAAFQPGPGRRGRRGGCAAIGYTLLTGSQVPTVRSCIAALLILAGMALGREAISIRLVAAGALVVLVFRPEALVGPSFQMSFAAVTAIVALHSTPWARRLLQRRDEGPGRADRSRAARDRRHRPGGRARADAARALPFPSGGPLRRGRQHRRDPADRPS